MSRAYTISPEDIRTQEFRSRMRGYDNDQVRSFLEVLADQVQHLHAEIRDLRNRLADANQQLDSSTPHSEVTDTSIPIHRVAEEYRQEAEADAHGVLAKARAEAESLIAAARSQVAGLRREIDDLKTHRDRIISQIETLLNSQLEHLNHLRYDLHDAEMDDAPEAPPTLANLDDTMPPT